MSSNSAASSYNCQKPHKQIKEGNKTTQEYILEMQPRYHHSQATLSKKQAIEIAKDRVTNTVYEGVSKRGLSLGQIYDFIR